MNEAVRLLQGDALAILKTLPDKSVDAVVTDPPYSSGGQFRGDRMQATSDKYQTSDTAKYYPEFGGDTRDQRGYLQWCALWLAECWRVAKPGAPVLVFSDWRQLPTTTDALQVAGWTWRGIVVWDKTEAARPDMGRFKSQAEYLPWGSKGPLPQNKEVGCLMGVFRVGVDRAEKLHVAGKPVALMRELVRICPAGGVVLDPFMGSGSTGLACREEGRAFIGVEMDPTYYAIAGRRLSQPLNAEADELVSEVARHGRTEPPLGQFEPSPPLPAARQEAP